MNSSQSAQNGNGVTKQSLAGSLASKLPVQYQEAGQVAEGWVHANPQRAALFSVGIGLALGLVGIPRVLYAVQMIRSVRSALYPEESMYE